MLLGAAGSQFQANWYFLWDTMGPYVEVLSIMDEGLFLPITWENKLIPAWHSIMT